MTRSVLIGLLACVAASPAVEDGVVVLTPDNFDDWISENPFALVEFYAPWCGHCKSLAPEWSAASIKTSRLSPPAPLAKVDADEHKTLAERFSISGYPTIKIFNKGTPTDYEGPREAKGIVKWVKSELGIVGASDSVTQLKKAEDLDALNAPALIGLFRMPVSASAMFTAFAEAAEDMDAYTGGKVKAAWSASYGADPVAQALGVKTAPAVLFIPTKGATPVPMTISRSRADFNEGAIIDFVTHQMKEAGISGSKDEV